MRFYGGKKSVIYHSYSIVWIYLSNSYLSLDINTKCQSFGWHLNFFFFFLVIGYLWQHQQSVFFFFFNLYLENNSTLTFLVPPAKDNNLPQIGSVQSSRKIFLSATQLDRWPWLWLLLLWITVHLDPIVPSQVEQVWWGWALPWDVNEDSSVLCSLTEWVGGHRLWETQEGAK